LDATHTDLELESRLAFIGGASRGIGKAIAPELGQKRADAAVGYSSILRRGKSA